MFIIEIIILCLFAVVVNCFVCCQIRCSVRLVTLLMYITLGILGGICFLTLKDFLYGYGFFIAMVWISLVSLVAIMHYKKEDKKGKKKMKKRIKELNQERWIDMNLFRLDD